MSAQALHASVQESAGIFPVYVGDAALAPIVICLLTFQTMQWPSQAEKNGP